MFAGRSLIFASAQLPHGIAYLVKLSSMLAGIGSERMGTLVSAVRNPMHLRSLQHWDHGHSIQDPLTARTADRSLKAFVIQRAWTPSYPVLHSQLFVCQPSRVEVDLHRSLQRKLPRLSRKQPPSPAVHGVASLLFITRLRTHFSRVRRSCIITRLLGGFGASDTFGTISK